MSIPFLSAAWYAEYDRLRVGVEVPDALRGLVANLNVSRPDGSILQAHFSDGFVRPGHVEQPAATISASAELTYRVLIAGDVQGALPAVFSGKLKIQGDKAALIKLGMTPDTASQKALRSQLKAITTLEGAKP